VGEVDVGFRSKLCSFFGLDRSSVYRQRKLDAKDKLLAAQIRSVKLEHPGYGHRRIADCLEIGKNRIRRVMKAYGIPSPKRRKRKYTKVSKGSESAPANLLKPHKVTRTDGEIAEVEGFVATHPHHIWAEDFTYLWFDNRFYYLATVIDLYSRQIVGWSLGIHHDTELVTKALMDGVSKYPLPTIIHNDQGTEYLSRIYQTICISLEINPSASAAGCPWENGFQESFYNHFKEEIDANNLNRFASEGELFEAIALQLHYYNTRRIHSALHTNPSDYAARFYQNQQNQIQTKNQNTNQDENENTNQQTKIDQQVLIAE
jgi:putative transposase